MVSKYQSFRSANHMPASPTTNQNSVSPSKTREVQMGTFLNWKLWREGGGGRIAWSSEEDGTERIKEYGLKVKDTYGEKVVQLTENDRTSTRPERESYVANHHPSDPTASVHIPLSVKNIQAWERQHWCCRAWLSRQLFVEVFLWLIKQHICTCISWLEIYIHRSTLPSPSSLILPRSLAPQKRGLVHTVYIWA